MVCYVSRRDRVASCVAMNGESVKDERCGYCGAEIISANRKYFPSGRRCRSFFSHGLRPSAAARWIESTYVQCGAHKAWYTRIALVDVVCERFAHDDSSRHRATGEVTW